MYIKVTGVHFVHFSLRQRLNIMPLETVELSETKELQTDGPERVVRSSSPAISEQWTLFGRKTQQSKVVFLSQVISPNYTNFGEQGFYKGSYKSALILMFGTPLLGLLLELFTLN